jgi:hypothetical protein
MYFYNHITALPLIQASVRYFKDSPLYESSVTSTISKSTSVDSLGMAEQGFNNLSVRPNTESRDNALPEFLLKDAKNSLWNKIENTNP